jgi:hypothetical protein
MIARLPGMAGLALGEAVALPGGGTARIAAAP